METTASRVRDSIVSEELVGRVYGMSLWFKGFAIAFLAIGLYVLAWFVRDLIRGTLGEDGAGAVIGLIFPLVGVGMAVKAFSSRIAFTEDSVERSWVMDRQSMPLRAICGRREYVVRSSRSGSTRYLRLEADDGSDPVDFGKNLYRFDEAFWEWFNRIPDLDARDKEEASDPQQHKDSNFGLV